MNTAYLLVLIDTSTGQILGGGVFSERWPTTRLNDRAWAMLCSDTNHSYQAAVNLMHDAWRQSFGWLEPLPGQEP